jgi:hypothetical protein
MKRVVFAFLFICASSFALEDTYANRQSEADKYMEIISIKNMLLGALDQAVDKRSGAANKKETKDMILKYLDINEFISEMKDVIVKNYTADELAAMNEFYSSESGKSILKKQSVISTEMNSKVQATILKMLMKIMNDKSLQKKTAPINSAAPTAI